jgi:outer membrane protein assembly factor BamB
MALKPLNCPSCGAGLEVEEDEAIIRCQYCNQSFERAIEPQPQTPAPSPAAPRPIVIEFKPPVTTPLPVQPKPKSSGGGCLLFLIVLIGVLAVGGSAFGILRLDQNSGLPVVEVPALLPSWRLAGPSVLVAPATDGPADVIMHVYDYGTENYLTASFNVQARKVNWTSKPLGKEAYTAQLLATGDRVFVSEGARVIALNRADGAVLWEAPLSDKIAGWCPSANCFTAVEDKIIARTADGYLQALDQTSGKKVWEYRFENTPGSFFLAGEKVLVVDNQDGDTALSVLSLTDGTAQTSFAPQCQIGDHLGDDFATGGQVFPDDAGQFVDVVYGVFALCAQRLDLATGKVQKQVGLDDASVSPMSAFVYAPPGQIFFGAYDHLYGLDLPAETSSELLSDKDFSYLPLTAQDQTLLVQVENSRGTREYGLWAVDVSSGKVLWKRNMGEAQPATAVPGSLFEGDQVWFALPTASGVHVITVQAGPHQLTLETLDWADGSSATPTTISISGQFDSNLSHPQIIGQRGDKLWFAVDSLYVIDLTAGKIEAQWP